MTIVSSAIVVGELQNYYTKFLTTGTLNKSQFPQSIRICESFLNKNSFIKLLFSDSWNPYHTSYRYMFRNDSNILGWPSIVRDRVMVYPTAAKYYVSDDDSTAVCNINAFGILKNDLVLLDALLKYRLTDATSLIVIDSTSVIDPVFTDSTSADSTATLIVNYNKLSELSKLIFIYLNLVVNQDVSYYNSESLISSSNDVLRSTYESYVLEKVFKFVADRGR